MFVKLTNGQIDQYPYTVGDLRRDNPNTSFPHQIPNEVFAEYGMVKVKATNQPLFDGIVERPKELTPVLTDGEWVQQWTTELHADAADRVRGHRNQLLSQSDWTQVADAPVDQTAWAIYRQSLRDIPEQEGFPNNVIWPVE